MSQTEVDAQRRNLEPPSGWVRTSFGEIYELTYGKSLPKAARNTHGDYAVYGSNGVVGHHDTFLVEGPVLIVGRKGAAGAVSFSAKSCWPIDTTYYVRDSEHIDIRFSFYLLTSLRLNQFDRSTAIPGLNRDDAYDLVVDLPPLPEQRRIVAKIGELCSELDKGIESLKTAQAQLKVYRQSVLKHAFEGKLTAQWREENKDKLEKPEQLLARIKQEREVRYERQLEEWKAAVKKWEEGGKSGKKPSKPKKVKELPPLTEAELAELPEGWSWLTIVGLLSLEKQGMTTGPFGTLLKKSEHRDRGIPVLGIENIGAGYFISGNKIFVTEKKALELDHFRVEGNDIIISRSGTVGEICKVPAGLGKAFLSTNLIRISLNENVTDSNYFVYLFQGGGSVKDQVRELCKGSTREFLNQTILSSIRFPIPPLSEQRQIVAEIENRLSVVDQLETDIEENFQKAAALRQSILKKAFSGQLVPQDPHDEPASVLLDRIRAEREKVVKSNHAKKTKKRKTTV